MDAEGKFLDVRDLDGQKYLKMDDSEMGFGGDPKSGHLENWANNQVAEGLKKHHPKVRR
jgi:hypothetical protein